jgi:hypothetical protein
MTMIPLSQLANELGVHPTNARKIAIKLGILPMRRQIRELGHNQRVLCWTREQANEILAARRRDGFEIPT